MRHLRATAYINDNVICPASMVPQTEIAIKLTLKYSATSLNGPQSFDSHFFRQFRSKVFVGVSFNLNFERKLFFVFSHETTLSFSVDFLHLY